MHITLVNRSTGFHTQFCRKMCESRELLTLWKEVVRNEEVRARTGQRRIENVEDCAGWVICNTWPPPTWPPPAIASTYWRRGSRIQGRTMSAKDKLVWHSQERLTVYKDKSSVDFSFLNKFRYRWHLPMISCSYVVCVCNCILYGIFLSF